MIIATAGSALPEYPFALFNNLLADPLTAYFNGSTAPGYDPYSLTRENTYQAWKGGGISAYVIFDLMSEKQFNTVAIAAHNLGLIGSRFRVLHSLDGVNYSIFATSETLTSSEALAMVSDAPITARYIRIANNVSPLPASAPVIAVASVGMRLEFPGWQGPDFVRPADAAVIEAQPFLSLEGHFLGSMIKRKAGRLAPRLSPLPRTWADANLAAFRAHYDACRPFFYAPGPNAFAGDLVYGWRADGAAELRPAVLTGGRTVSLAMELGFYVA